MRTRPSLRHLVLVAALSPGCLPEDTRPPPGELLTTVASDQALQGGLAATDTSDGWSIHVDRLLLALGNVSADGDDCLTYSDPDYRRVLVLPRAGAQKLSVLYALGPCSLSFSMGPPRETSVLGEGATDADRTELRTPHSNAYDRDRGVSARVRGHAEKDGRVVRFDWAYLRTTQYRDCSAGEPATAGVTFRSRETLTRELVVRGGALFQDRVGPDGARLGFQAYADADADADGDVTLEELAAVPLDQAGHFDGDGGATDHAYPTLADFLYLGLFPGLVAYEGTGHCSVRTYPGQRSD